MTITNAWGKKVNIELKEFEGLTIAEAHKLMWTKQEEYVKEFTRSSWQDMPPCEQGFNVSIGGDTDNGGHYELTFIFVRHFASQIDLPHKMYAEENVDETKMVIFEEKDFVKTGKIEVTEKGFVF